MKRTAEAIQDSELEVMRVLWSAGGTAPLLDIRHALPQWEDSTTKTLLRRLQMKGAVRLERRGIYSAVISEEDYHRWSARSFVSKLFSGSAKSLVATLVANGDLSEADLRELADLFHKEADHEHDS